MGKKRLLDRILDRLLWKQCIECGMRKQLPVNAGMCLNCYVNQDVMECTDSESVVVPKEFMGSFFIIVNARTMKCDKEGCIYHLGQGN